jgi:hypothetical protein
VSPASSLLDHHSHNLLSPSAHGVIDEARSATPPFMLFAGATTDGGGGYGKTPSMKTDNMSATQSVSSTDTDTPSHLLSFTKTARRLAHVTSGSRAFTCNDCTKSFQNNSALMKHRLIHSDDRQFTCPICKKAFKRQDHL